MRWKKCIKVTSISNKIIIKASFLNFSITKKKLKMKSKTYSIKSMTSNQQSQNYKKILKKLKYSSKKLKINSTSKLNNMEKIIKNGKSNSKTDNSLSTKETNKFKQWTYKSIPKSSSLKKIKPQWNIIVLSFLNLKKVLCKKKRLTIKSKHKGTISL